MADWQSGGLQIEASIKCELVKCWAVDLNNRHYTVVDSDSTMHVTKREFDDYWA